MSDYVDATVRQGRLKGARKCTRFHFEYFAFYGIPYAKPLIGERRFKDLEPSEPWSDVLNVSKFKENNCCIHSFRKNPHGSENCLYLSVWYSRNIAQQAKLAVMVWIHGGAYDVGSDSYVIYGPNYILLDNVVLVTINYRLGVFGFLNLGNEMAPDNQGLKDALMALRWVHDNISNFGGDAKTVTIYGQGFGGCMVHYLAMCPQADDLLHRAISQSGNAANSWAFSDSCMAMSLRLFKEIFGTDVVDLNEAARLLKSVSPSQITWTAENILTTNEQRQLILPFVPSLDYGTPNPFFVEHPALMLRRGIKVPFIIGFTTCEGSIFVRDMDDAALNQVNSDFKSVIHPRISPTLWEKSITVEDVYIRHFGNKPVSRKTNGEYINFISDMHFYRGIYETASIQAQLDHHQTHMYHFAYESGRSLIKTLLKVDTPGTIYGEELFFLFYPRISYHMRKRRCLPCAYNFEKSIIINSITKMWTDFAKMGNPTPVITASVPKWSPIEREDKFQYLIMDQTCRIETMQKKNLRFYGVM